MTISSQSMPLGGSNCPYFMYQPQQPAAAADHADATRASFSSAAGGGASTPTPTRPAATSGTSGAPPGHHLRLPIQKTVVVESSPLALPANLPRASIMVLSVRLSPGSTTAHPRSCLVPAQGPNDKTAPRHAYLLLNQLTKAKDRVRIWLAQVLSKEDHDQDQDNENADSSSSSSSSSSSIYTLASPTHVVIKESDARFIRQYGRLWGEDPVSEVSALLRLQAQGGHANVVPLHAAFEGIGPSTDMLYIVLPHLAGDELFYQVTTAPGHQGLGEEETRPIFRQVLAGLLHMKHTQGLRHGDISPENVMVGPDGHVTLIDLGMAECVPTLPPNTTSTPHPLLEARPRRGKKQYMAPEIYEEVAYDAFAADVWALGALLYVCWTGCTVYRSPYDHHFLNLKHPFGLLQLLEEREANGSTRSLSPEAKDLLQGMLSWRFETRLTLEEIAAHPWVRAMVEEEQETDSEGGGVEEEEDMGGIQQLLLLSNSSSVSSLSMLDNDPAADEEDDGLQQQQQQQQQQEAVPARPSTPSSSSTTYNKPTHINNCDHEDNSASSLQSMHMENNHNNNMESNDTYNNCCAAASPPLLEGGQEGEEEEEDMRTVSTAFSSSLGSTLSSSLE